jgi:hypothetical protein
VRMPGAGSHRWRMRSVPGYGGAANATGALIPIGKSLTGSEIRLESPPPKFELLQAI